MMVMIQAPRPLGVGGAVADILACPPRSDYDIPGMDGDGGGGDGERTDRQIAGYISAC